jgi:hypothetical protein
LGSNGDTGDELVGRPYRTAVLGRGKGSGREQQADKEAHYRLI